MQSLGKVFFFLEVTTPSSGFAGLPSQVREEGAGRAGARDAEEKSFVLSYITSRFEDGRRSLFPFTTFP